VTASDADWGWIDRTCRVHPWGAWRCLDHDHPGTSWAAVLHSLRRTPADQDIGLVVTRGPDARPLAATFVCHKPIESTQFGVNTAAIGEVVTEPAGSRADHARSLLRDVVHRAAKRAAELVTLRVDAADVELLASAQDVGFRVCEATVAWLANDLGAADRRSSSVRIETFEGAAIPSALTAAEIATMTASTAAWPHSHYRADPNLTRAQVDRFYGVWIDNVTSGRWCDILHVARVDDRLAGLLSEVVDRDLRQAGGPAVRTTEWLHSVTPGVGVGRELLTAAAARLSERGSYRWWETQLRNAPTIRSIEATAAAVPARAGYTMHAWTGR
jgi:ribosomal protein S18 acetylase RimI-like enzyme